MTISNENILLGSKFVIAFQQETWLCHCILYGLTLKEQDESSDIEQHPPFDGRK